MAAAMRTHVNLDQLKATAREHFSRASGKRRPFNFYRMVGRYMTDTYGYRDQLRERWGGEHGKKNS